MLLLTGSSALAADDPDLSRFFAGVDGTFVLLGPDRTVRHNPQRAAVGYIPASTFKIPNTVIALDTGVATGPTFHLAWNSARDPKQDFWPEAWARGQTLKSAFTNSVVWFYQELARRIGPQRMQAYLKKLQYGNQDMSGGIDQFWLRGGLRISADQQVMFLRNLLTGQLPVKRSSVSVVRELLLLEMTDQYRLAGKTGTANLDNGRQLGWLVGYVVVSNRRTYYYALNVDAPNASAWSRQRRIDTVRSILQTLEVLPRHGSQDLFLTPH